MKWKLEFSDNALKDLNKLDNSTRRVVIKSIDKVLTNPLPYYEGGYGKPLGNKNGMDLSGYYKIKLNKIGIRILYRLIREDNIFRIVVVGFRNDMEVYEIAYKRKLNNED